ncbi:MAG TPA: WGR domain-containing protein [Polyangiaceae bacterium]|nr:WGR domain-containing protein [Polyangiaceae bacterium]
MRIVDQARLWFREGNSDKVYEVDLVEITVGQHVVNFRFGRRGTALRDGTKTPLPVSLEQARSIFTTLVAEKTARGYKPLNDDQSAQQGTNGDRTREPKSADPAQRTEQLLLEALRLGRRSKIPIHLVVRKVGERGLRQAEPYLLELLAAETSPRGEEQPALRHHLLVALGRCGTTRSVAALRAVVDDAAAPRHLRDVALLALTTVGGAEQRQRARESVPPELMPHPSEDLTERVHAAELLLARNPQRAHAAILSLYASALARPKDAQSVEPGSGPNLDRLARRIVFAVVRIARAAGEELGLLRALTWAAEVRRDAELFALLTRQFENQAAEVRESVNYFRRRAARTLRRLGSVGSVDYVPMATELLLQYHDQDAERIVRSEHGIWDEFAHYHALNLVLYGNSSRYARAAHRRATWRCRAGYEPGGAVPTTREESFPELWDKQPSALWRLGISDAASVVIQFAVRALRDQAAYLAQIGDEELAHALGRARRPMRQLAFEITRQRAPNLVLARAALDSELGEAGEWVLTWIRSTPGLLGQHAELLALLITAKSINVRDAVGSLARGLTLEGALGRELVLSSIAILMGLEDTPTDEQRAASAASFLLARATSALSDLGVAVLHDLVTHPLASVAEFGASLVLRRSERTALEQTLLDGVLGSKHAAVRAIGARIVANTPPELVKDEPDVLVQCALSNNTELRVGTRGLVGTVAQRFPEIGKLVAAQLVDALLTRQAEGVPAHIVSLLRKELHACLPQRTAAQVLKLVGALSPHARECGGLLLGTLGPDEFELDALVRLAHHEILSIRQGAWILLQGAKDRFQVAPAALARLCDARWEDTRAFAFEFVRSFPGDQLVPDTVIAILDSIEPLVQRFGQTLLHEHWRDQDAERYLLRLSEHPSSNIQLLVTTLLDRYARGNLALLERLLPCLTTVLCQVNRGGIAKQRVLEFLRTEALSSREAAQLIAPLLERQSLTLAVSHKAPIIATMVSLHERYPEVPVPLVPHPITVQERSRRGV